MDVAIKFGMVNLRLHITCLFNGKGSHIKVMCLIGTAFSIGDGRRINFQKDKWCGDIILCYKFPNCLLWPETTTTGEMVQMVS